MNKCTYCGSVEFDRNITSVLTDEGVVNYCKKPECKSSFFDQMYGNKKETIEFIKDVMQFSTNDETIRFALKTTADAIQIEILESTDEELEDNFGIVFDDSDI